MEYQILNNLYSYQLGLNCWNLVQYGSYMVEQRSITTARAHYLNNLANSCILETIQRMLTKKTTLFPTNNTKNRKTTLPVIVKTKKGRKRPFVFAIHSTIMIIIMDMKGQICIIISIQLTTSTPLSKQWHITLHNFHIIGSNYGHINERSWENNKPSFKF